MNNFTIITKVISILIFTLCAVRCEKIVFEPSKESYEENEKLTLACETEIEPGYCKLFRGNQEINNDTSNRYQINALNTCILTITPLTLEDDAWWSCKPQNTSVTFSKLLTIEIKQVVQLIPSEPTRIHVEEGKTADLECQFNSSAPSCYWLKGDEMIAIRGRYQYIGNQNKGNCTIRINKVNWRDDGKWRCCYPVVDKWPAIKSSIITLIITVIPPAPIITVNGIKVENEAEIFISTTFTKPYVQNFNEDNGYEREILYKEEYESPYNSYKEPVPVKPEILTKLNDTILCWSRNAFPTADLSWELEDEYGTQLHYLDNNFAHDSWNSVNSQNLKTSNVELQLHKDKFNGIQRTKLKCIATHPGYKEEFKTTFIWLTWANKINENYYAMRPG